MRLLIAGGGTGGHIYPALAVARSLRARPDAPELGWLGGHRGLEAELVPAAGHPAAAARAALAPNGRGRRPRSSSTRSGSARVRPAGGGDPRRASGPRPIFTTGGYVAIPVLMAAAPLGIPIAPVGGQRHPGSRACARPRGSRRRSRSRSRRPARRCLGRARAPCYVTGTPIRDRRDVDREAARARLGIGPAERGPAGLRRLAGGAPVQRRVSGALPRLVERVTVLHVTGDDGYAAALADREALPEAARGRYRPYPFLRDEMLAALAAADLVVGGPARRPWPRSTALGLPIVVVPYPHAGGHQRANARIARRRGRGAARRRRRASMRPRCWRRPASSTTRRPTLAMSAAARALGRPGAADAVADLVLAAARREPLPDPAVIERRSSGRAA